MRLIDADALFEHKVSGKIGELSGDFVPGYAIGRAQTIDAVPIVRCKDCIYFRKEHVLTPDGQRKSYSEMPPEAFGGFLKIKSVTSSYGINIGSQCLVDCDRGYGEDKTVFRRPEDYCGRGKRRDSDG